jgi:anti-anti-sigma factor
MEFAQEQADEALIIKLSGRLDSTTAQSAEDHFTRAVGTGAAKLAVDMSKLDYISSAGLRILLVIAKKLQQGRGKMVLYGLVPNVREVFAISGFDKIFVIQASAEDALGALA